MSTIRRKAWMIYFPQFDKFYPHVNRGSNSFTHILVGPDEANIFTNEASAKRVVKLYNSFFPHNVIDMKDIATNDTEWVERPCVPNCVAEFELNFADIDHYFYDSRKSVVPDPYNTALEVRLIEFEIDVPTK